MTSSLQHAHQGCGVAGVGDLIVDVLRAVADGEAVLAVVGLGPPTVEDRAVQPAVEHGLHAAGAGGFLGSARVVEPDVDALDQVPGDVDVVVFDEHDAAGEARIVAQVGDLLDELLAGLVGRVGLAGEDELHRSLRVVDQLEQLVELAEEQVGSLVGGEAAGEADRQRAGVEHVAGGFDGGSSSWRRRQSRTHAAADEVQQPALQRVVRLPQLAGVDVVERSARSSGSLTVCLPVGAQVAVVELVHRIGEPAGDVDAVGDVADGDFFFDAPRPEVRPHAARDVAVQRADRVGPARELEADDGHAEGFVLVLRLDAAEAHQLRGRNAQRVAQRAQVLFDQSGVEAVVAGGHGRVGGEDGVLGDFAERFVERQAVVGHPLANHFERSECAVAFVEVVDARRDAQRAERLDAADAEHQFLADAGADVAAVEAAR